MTWSGKKTQTVSKLTLSLSSSPSLSLFFLLAPTSSLEQLEEKTVHCHFFTKGEFYWLAVAPSALQRWRATSTVNVRPRRNIKHKVRLKSEQRHEWHLKIVLMQNSDSLSLSLLKTATATGGRGRRRPAAAFTILLFKSWLSWQLEHLNSCDQVKLTSSVLTRAGMVILQPRGHMRNDSDSGSVI